MLNFDNKDVYVDEDKRTITVVCQDDWLNDTEITLLLESLQDKYQGEWKLRQEKYGFEANKNGIYKYKKSKCLAMTERL